MDRGRRRGLALAGAALLAASGQTLAAYSETDKAPAPLILSVQADLDRGTLTIRGRNLGSPSAPPKVTLAGEALAVQAAGGESVVAELPEGVASGSHLLELSRDPRGTLTDRFTANVPATELVTPAGIRIESNGSDVLIVAGDSRVTVDPAGGVSIESAGNVNIRAGGTLSLRGRTVTVSSDTTLSLAAPVINLN